MMCSLQRPTSRGGVGGGGGGGAGASAGAIATTPSEKTGCIHIALPSLSGPKLSAVLHAFETLGIDVRVRQYDVPSHVGEQNSPHVSLLWWTGILRFA